MKITIKEFKGLIKEAVSELKAPQRKPKSVTITVGQLKKMIKESLKGPFHEPWKVDMKEAAKDMWEEIQSDETFMQENELEPIEGDDFGFKGPTDSVKLVVSQLGVGQPRISVKSMKGKDSGSLDDVSDVKHYIVKFTKKSTPVKELPLKLGGPEAGYDKPNRYHGD